MLIKYGVDMTRVQKDGPVVKQGVRQRFSRRLKCHRCGATLEKECPNELACELASGNCPTCGAELS